MLLVHDDGAEIRQRREDRRPRAHGDALLPALEREPGVVAFAVAQRRVQDGHAVAEHGPEAIDRLRGEGDLRHEHDRRLPAPLDDLAQELDVDERLPAPRDAVQQEDLARRCAHQRIDRGALRRRGRVLRHARPRAPGEGIARHHGLLDRHQLAVGELLHERAREAELVHEMPDGDAPAHPLDGLVQLALPLRPRERAVALGQRRQLAREHHDPFGLARGVRRCGAREQRRQRAPHHLPERHDVVVGDEPAEHEERAAQRGLGVGDFQDRPRPSDLGVPFTEVDADRPARPQRDDDARARHERMLGLAVDDVGEGAKEGERDRDLGEARRGHARRTPSPGASGRVISPRSMVVPTKGSFARSVAPSRSA